MKKFCLFVLCLILLAGCKNHPKENDPIGEKPASTVITDGKYKGNAPSYNGELILEIEVTDSTLTAIQVIQNQDTTSITNRAFPLMEEKILTAQTPNVEAISSATFSSTAYKNAVAKAMKQAGFDTTKELKNAPAPMEDTQGDLVIVGAGPSGLTAAIEAKENGVDKIILIEKEDILSGNGKFDEFFFDFPNTKAQKEAGIKDSREDYRALLKSYKGFDRPDMLEKRINEVWEFDTWLRNHGIEANYVEDQRNHTHSESEVIGEYTQDRLENLVKNLRIDIRPSTKMNDLLMDGNKVIGVECEYKGYKYTIRADRILIATGGFSSNKDMVAKYIPKAAKYISSNTIGQTGDMVDIAVKHNIKLSNMDVCQLFNLVVVPTRYQLEARSPGAIIVNKNGERFLNEQDYYSFVFANAILAQEGGVAYYIYDQEKHDERTNGMGLGEYNKSDSLKELADKLDINYKNLLGSIQSLRDIASANIQDVFGNESDGNPISLNSKHYYGTKIVPSIHMTYGGIEVDSKMRVLDNDGNVIENLYACGEVTSTTGIYLEALLFGRLAGEEIAKSLH